MDIQEIGLQLIKDSLSEYTQIGFKNNFFEFYYDNNGQRLHYIIPYNNYGTILPNQYVIKRLLSFTNKEDEGKNDAILGVLNLNKSKVLEIHKNKVVFEFFTIYLNEYLGSGNRNEIKKLYKKEE